jgi:NTE family protein
VAHQRYDTLPAGPFDLVMRPPCPLGIQVTDFDRHTEIFQASYLWARQAIVALDAEGNSALTAILAAGKPATMRGADLVDLAGNARSS